MAIQWGLGSTTEKLLSTPVKTGWFRSIQALWHVITGPSIPDRQNVSRVYLFYFFYECWWKSCIQIILIYFDVFISWLLFHFPVFWQAPCPSPPPYVENGIRLFIGQEHGRRARYICNNGFRLSGMTQSSPYLICDKGQWKGGNPACQECEYNLKSRQENKHPPLMFIIQWNKTA